MTYSYIYLLQDGLDRNTNIFKIGMTEQNSDDSRKLTRLQDYSKGTIVFNTYCVPKCHVRQIETDIKMVFSTKYKLCRGTEWFKGDSHNMKKDIDTIINKYCEHQTMSRDDETICTEDSDDEYSTMDFNSIKVVEPTKHKMVTIDAAIVCLNHAENAKLLTEQTYHFQLELNSNLKEYLDIIKSNPFKWYQNAPKGFKSKSRFHKYKAPVCALLEHKDVVSACGQSYCATLLKSIKQTFRESIDKVIDEKDPKKTAPNTDDGDSTDGDCSELDIDTLEVVEPERYDLENTTEEIPKNTTNKKYDDLLVKYKSLKEQHLALQRDYHKLQGEYIARADAELARVWESHNKLTSKCNTTL
jgi:hypothetical protein